MANRSDWIRVELSAAELAEADRVGRLQADYARKRGFRAKGMGGQEMHRLGWLGELAVARYEGVIRDSDWTWEADKRRGHDVAGWQVRTRSNPRYGLILNPGDAGRFLLALAHDQPAIWLVGWLLAADGFLLSTPRNDHDFVWHLVEQRHLHPLPEQHGYSRCAEKQLVDPGAVFWCEGCGGTHPISQHRLCRAGSA